MKSSAGSIACELRQLAILDCLHWDCQTAQMVQLAHEGLKQDGASAEDWSHVALLVPAAGLGSGVEIWLKTTHGLQRARNAMKAVWVEYLPKRSARVGAGRERREAAPVNVVRRLRAGWRGGLRARTQRPGCDPTR